MPNNLGLFILIAFFFLFGCKSTINNLTLSTCKSIETNSRKCSELISSELDAPLDKNHNEVSEGEFLSQ